MSDIRSGAFDNGGELSSQTLLLGNALFEGPSTPGPSTPSVPTNASQCSQPKSIGQLGEYILLRELGRGGMGVVYEAMQPSLNRRVAVKTLPQTARLEPRQVQRFLHEAQAAAQLNHPHIVPVYSVGTADGLHYYTMQLIEGRDVARYIREARSLCDSHAHRGNAETPLNAKRPTEPHPAPARQNSFADSVPGDGSTISVPVAEFAGVLSGKQERTAHRSSFDVVVQIGIQAAEALHYAHQVGVVHRDVKPSNLMLDHEGKLWVTDFGLAQVQGVAAMTMTGEVVGTLRYMSPEQPLGQRVLVDQRTDIYSLGVTLYELLTLEKAFGGTTSREIIRQVCFDEPIRIRRRNSRVPEDLETIVMKAMAKNPDERYQTARELAEDLERFRQDKAILARRPTLLQQGRRWVRRNVALATAIAIGIVCLLLVSLSASGMIWSALQAETQQRRRVESALKQSEGLRLAASSLLVNGSNPGLAVLLAVRAAELYPCVDTNTALMTAMNGNHELFAFSPRKERSAALSFSPDGKRILSAAHAASAIGTRYPLLESDPVTGALLRTYDDGGTMIGGVYSPDGRLMLSTSLTTLDGAEPKTGEVRCVLWDTETGERRFTFSDVLKNSCRDRIFSKAGDEVVIPGSDGTVKVFSTTDGRLVKSLQGHTQPVVCCSFDERGDQIVSAADDHTVRVWSCESAQQIQQFALEPGAKNIRAEILKSDLEVLISSSKGTFVGSVETGLPLNSGHLRENTAVADRSGRTAALYLLYGKQVNVVNVPSCQITARISVDSQIAHVEFSADSKNLLICTVTEAVVADAATGRIHARMRGHAGAVIEARFSPNSLTVVSASHDRTIRLWSLKNWGQRQIIATDMVRVLPYPWAVSADSRQIAVAIRPGEFTELRDADGKLISASVPGSVNRRGFNGSRLVTHDDHEVIVWNSESLQQIAVLHVPSAELFAARIVPGTDFVVVLVHNGPPLIWNIRSGEKVSVSAASNQPSDMDVHPQDALVAVCGRNGDCCLIDVATARVTHEFHHQRDCRTVRFSPSGIHVLTIDSTNSIMVWNPGQNTTRQVFRDDSSGRLHAVWGLDDTTILTWRSEATTAVHCLNAETGAEVRRLPDSTVSGLSVHPAETVAAITSAENGLRLWNWTTGDVRTLTTAPARTPVFHRGQLYAVEGSADFVATSETLYGFPDDQKFAQSALSIRDGLTGQLKRSTPLSMLVHLVSADAGSGRIAISGLNYMAEVTSLDDGNRIAEIRQHTAPLPFMAFAGNTTRLICAGLDGRISVGDASGQRLLPDRHKSPIRLAQVSHDGRRLASIDTSGKGFLWDLDRSEFLLDLPGMAAAVNVLEMSPDNVRLAMGSADGTLILFDLIARSSISVKQDSAIADVQWSNDGNQLLVMTEQGSRDPVTSLTRRNVLVLNAQTLKATTLVSVREPRLAAWRPGHRQIGIVTDDGRLILYDPVRNASVVEMTVDRRRILDMAFSPDGQDLLLSHDDELSLWNLDSQREQLRVPSRDQTFLNAELKQFRRWQPFSPDGKWILSTTPALKKSPRVPLSEDRLQTLRPLSDSERKQYSVDTLIPNL